MTDPPLVSVIVPTRNSATFLEACLRSIRGQSYPNVEIIVVDNHSTDATRQIAAQYADTVVVSGPERSAQVNEGARRARGSFVYKVDSDFVLEGAVIEQCLEKAATGFDAVVVHNSPDTRPGWLGRIRRFEVDMYKYDLAQSSARFVRKDVFDRLGGFDETITAGEDYDFQNRLNDAGYRTGFVDAEALHLGEPIKLLPHLRKYHRYGREFATFTERNPATQLRFLRPVYVRNWRMFLAHPLRGLGFATYNVLKYAAGGSGYLREKAARAGPVRKAAAERAHGSLGRGLRDYRDRWVLSRSSRNFESVLDTALRIPGFTSPIELSFLYHAVLALPGDGRIVEIGSYLGRSTVVLAHAAAVAGRTEIVAVDPHTGDLTLGGEREDTLQRFLRNIEDAGIAGQVELLHATSVDAAARWSGGDVELLFVDGLHTREAVLADIGAWSPHFAEGACIVFDDYMVYPAVRSAIRETRAVGDIRGTAVVVGKMIAFAKPELLARVPTPPFARLLPRLGEGSINRVNRILEHMVS